MKSPADLDALTPAWFTEGLREAGVVERAEVTALDVTPLGLEHGFLSIVGRVALTYDVLEDSAPASVVVKLELGAGAMRDFDEELHAFEREIRFYTEIAPTVPIRLARLYFATTEPPDFAMVMEDLTFARAGDQVAGLHATEVQTAAATMGRLQGHAWGEARVAHLDWMPRTNGMGTDWDQKWPSFVEHFGHCLDGSGRALGERMMGRVDWLDAEIARRPQTIVHTDLRADNLMLGPKGTPEEILILDWQLAIRSMGAFDVARLMGGSELPDERHGHQLDVLRTWHDALRDAGVDDYPWDDALRDLRLGALSALCYPVHFHRGVLDATGRAKEVVEVMCRRLFDSATEMDAGAVLP